MYEQVEKREEKIKTQKRNTVDGKKKREESWSYFEEKKMNPVVQAMDRETVPAGSSFGGSQSGSDVGGHHGNEGREYLYRVDTRDPREIEKEGFKGREASQLSGSVRSNEGKQREEMAFSAASFSGGNDREILQDLRLAGSVGAGQGYLYRFKQEDNRLDFTEQLRGWDQERNGTEGALEHNVVGEVAPIRIEYFLRNVGVWIRLDGNVMKNIRAALINKR